MKPPFKPGAELDGMVAMQVFGAPPLCIHEGTERPSRLDSRYTHAQGGCGLPVAPAFSTEIAAAWQITARDGLESFELSYDRPLTEGERPSWRCRLIVRDLLRAGEATAETAPMAICLAALKAVGK